LNLIYMNLQQFLKFDQSIIDGKDLSFYEIQMPQLKSTEFTFDNVILLFRTISLLNKKSEVGFNHYLHTVSLEKSISSQEILEKDFDGFNPFSAIIIKCNKNNALKLIEQIKSQKDYVIHFRDL